MGKGNHALLDDTFVVNDRTVDIHITVRGSDWYWAVMSVMGTTMCVIIGLGLSKPRTHRLFYHILAAVTLVAMVEHYAMAANLGWVPIDVEWQRSEGIVRGVNRQIWWVRYCAWFLTWPLLSLVLCLTAVAPVANTLWTIFLSCDMAILALVGAMVKTDFKWGFYGFWCACWVGLVYNLLFTVRQYARALGSDIHRAYVFSSGWILLLWMIYPICWGCGEGGNVIAPDSEFIWYGILDCMLIPVTSAYFILEHWRIDPGRLGLYMRDFDDPIPGDFRRVTDEKAEAAGGETNGVTNGQTAESSGAQA